VRLGRDRSYWGSLAGGAELWGVALGVDLRAQAIEVAVDRVERVLDAEA
jgi:hypothetical protein